jgi:hypothetical protein
MRQIDERLDTSNAKATDDPHAACEIHTGSPDGARPASVHAPTEVERV